MKDEALKRIVDSGVLPGQRYKHFKTGTIYLVVAVGLFEADLEPLVHYRDADDEYGIVWTRHLGIFCGRSLQPGTPPDAVLVKRFTQVE